MSEPGTQWFIFEIYYRKVHTSQGLAYFQRPLDATVSMPFRKPQYYSNWHQPDRLGICGDHGVAMTTEYELEFFS